MKIYILLPPVVHAIYTRTVARITFGKILE